MEAERSRQDPLIGLHAGELCEPRGPVAYLLMSHGSLEDGLRAMTRVAPLAVDRIRLDLDIGLDMASLFFHPHDPTFESSPHAVEYLLMATLTCLSQWSGAATRPRFADTPGDGEAAGAVGAVNRRRGALICGPFRQHVGTFAQAHRGVTERHLRHVSQSSAGAGRAGFP